MFCSRSSGWDLNCKKKKVWEKTEAEFYRRLDEVQKVVQTEF